MKDELDQAENELNNLKGSMLNSQNQKIDSRELEKMEKKIQDLEDLIRKLKRDNKESNESRDMYKKELDNLTFEYDKLSREARNHKQEKIKLEKKLKTSINEFILVQEEKARIEEEKKYLQEKMILIREEARKEVSEMSELKLDLEQKLLRTQQQTAQIFVDYEAHRKLIKLAGRFQINIIYFKK